MLLVVVLVLYMIVERITMHAGKRRDLQKHQLRQCWVMAAAVTVYKWFTQTYEKNDKRTHNGRMSVEKASV